MSLTLGATAIDWITLSLVLFPPLGETGEDSFFDMSGGDLINEIAPRPRLLVGEGTTTLTATASNANSSREIGSFPQLDSSLLQVRTCTYYIYLHVWHSCISQKYLYLYFGP